MNPPVFTRNRELLTIIAKKSSTQPPLLHPLLPRPSPSRSDNMVFRPNTSRLALGTLLQQQQQQKQRCPFISKQDYKHHHLECQLNCTRHEHDDDNRHLHSPPHIRPTPPNALPSPLPPLPLHPPQNSNDPPPPPPAPPLANPGLLRPSHPNHSSDPLTEDIHRRPRDHQPSERRFVRFFPFFFLFIFIFIFFLSLLLLHLLPHQYLFSFCGS